MKNFFFLYKNVLIRTINESKKTYKILKMLDKDAFDFLYEMFVGDGTWTTEGAEYATVKIAFFRAV